MSKIVTIKLTKTGPSAGPFRITDILDNVIVESVSKKNLIQGVNYEIADTVTSIYIESLGECKIKKLFNLESFNIVEFMDSTYKESRTGCIWRHLTNIEIYNIFYGNIEPYVIEYPFTYRYHDEITQNIKDFTSAYKYLPIPDGVYNDNDKIQTDDQYFNKAIIYNGQQCSGVLELVPKPMNNLKAYMQYPIYNTESKTITYTKSDNFYQYNNFWSVVKNKSLPLFVTGCESLSIDKVINQANMDYGVRSFKKDTIRAKGLLIRHILDNKSDARIISQFIVAPAMISYK
jgi:hypothetical protein